MTIAVNRNFSGVVLQVEIAERLVKSTTAGRSQMNEFIQNRLNSHEVSFWDPLQSLKIKTFDSAVKKVTVLTADEKLVTIGADRDLAVYCWQRKREK